MFDKIQKLKELLSTFDYSSSVIFSTDSYKFSHYLQYPKDAEFITSYVVARKNNAGYDSKLTFYGLQHALKKYLTRSITQNEIEAGALFAELHGVPFNREGWQFILDECGGRMPVQISAVPEGTRLEAGNAVAVIRNTVRGFIWPVGYIEALIMRGCWYGSTVATYSANCVDLFRTALKESSDLEGADLEGALAFKFHDFGARGVNVGEGASVAGSAHALNSSGSDTVEGILEALMVYDADSMPAFSIPAAEHSTITSWGEKNEIPSYRNMLEVFSGKYPFVAVVSDSYDQENAVDNIWGGTLREEVLRCGSTVVVRLDSGDPLETIPLTLNSLWESYGGTINKKGYKVINPAARIIQGDGVSLFTTKAILKAVLDAGFSAENLALGSGGKLLQSHSRDDWSFAIKVCSIIVNGVEYDVQKKPKTDPSKKSFAGVPKVIKEDGVYKTVREAELGDNILEVVFEVTQFTGLYTKFYKFEEVKANSIK